MATGLVMSRARRLSALRPCWYVQVAMTSLCVLGVWHYVQIGQHPIGTIELEYRWAPVASALLLLWIFIAARIAPISRRRRIIIVIVSVLLTLITEMASETLLIGE